MKTLLMRAAALMWAAALSMGTGGCVEHSGRKSETTTDASPGSEATVAASAEANSAPTTSTNTAPETTDVPPVRRSGRASRVFPDEVTRVIELVEAGGSEEVARAYVEASTVSYELSLDDVLYLRDIGIPDGVVAAMMRRGADLRQQQADTAMVQTNMAQAVQEIRTALAASSNSVPADPSAPPAPEVATADPSVTPGPAPLPQATAVVPADAPAEVQPFYETLSPYGSWYQVPSYGWVWQPSVVVVNTGWSPYCQGGRWVWSDWGWYWASEYSWGWAPFHYGRWATYPGLGWCWVPGTTWGPSWVTWRSHGAYVGWAPLPPACGWTSGVGLTWYGSSVSVGFGFGLASSCYTFVSYGNFCHRNVGRHAVARDRSTAIYNNSTVVNNVIHGNNNTIVNNGVGYDQVAKLSRSEIPKARVEPLPETSDQTVRVDRMERGGDGTVIYRPTAVQDAGGRPTALRAESRPVSSSAGLASSPTTSSRQGFVAPSRPGMGSRFSERPTPSGMKEVESRGSGRGETVSGVMTPSSMPARPNVGISRGSSVARTPTGYSPGSVVPKAVDGRSAGSPVVGAPAAGGASGSYSAAPRPAVVGPTRQTAPVPLSDPSRYVNRGRQPTSAMTPTVKPAYEGRDPVPRNPALDTRQYETRSAPVANASPAAPMAPVAPTYSRSPASGMPAPTRTPSPAAGPKVDYSRPAVGATRTYQAAPAPAVSAPRPSYSAPAPAASVPRSSYSAPSPSSAPRSSYTAPAPAPSIPRAPVASPAPSAPSRPAPSAAGGRSSGGGGRVQPN